VQRRSSGSGMDAVGDRRAQILAESSREPQPLQRRESAHGWDGRWDDRRAKHLHDRGRGNPLLWRRFLRGPRLENLNVPPRVALGYLAGATARAFGVAERQAHLEREIGAQEVRQIGAVGPNKESHRVFAQTQMVEKDIA